MSEGKPKKGSWEEYVSTQLASEQSLDFSDDEISVIKQIIKSLEASQDLSSWTELGTEFHRMFLRGYWDRKDVVGDVCSSIIETSKFRRKFNVKKIFAQRFDKHDLYHTAYPSYIAGEDIYGHWISYESVREIDTSALQHFTTDELLQYRTQHLEAQMEIKRKISMRIGKRVCRYIFILNLDGLSYTTHFGPTVRKLLQPLFTLSGDRYPESLWTLWCINTPRSFKLIWRVIQPWIDPVVKKKIRFLGGRREYLPAMQSTGIPLESIPADLGGKSKLVSMSDIIDGLIEDENSRKTDLIQFTTNQAFPGTVLDVDILSEARNDIIVTGKALDKKIEASNRRSTLDFVAPNALIPDEEVLVEGWLEKKGFFNRAWRKRYFVLIPSGLYYFAEKPSEENRETHRGKIDSVVISDVNFDKSLGTWEIETPYRNYFLRFEDKETEETKEIWVDEIEKAITLVRYHIEKNLKEESFVKNGFLFKRGRINKSFKRRFFVLTTRRLYYYTDVNTNIGAVLKGKIHLKKVQRVESKSSDEQDSKLPFEFKLVTARRTYIFKSKGKEEAEEWMGQINTQLVEYQEVQRQERSSFRDFKKSRKSLRVFDGDGVDRTRGNTEVSTVVSEADTVDEDGPEDAKKMVGEVLGFWDALGVFVEGFNHEEAVEKINGVLTGMSNVVTGMFNTLRQSFSRADASNLGRSGGFEEVSKEDI
eukprot:snap_masked-scaffold_54-processed-gene-0.24-mRNA-1 protein AED:1.00 eAED:1.00 QI:0/-1/0/0/-1/1/1/0/703